MGGQVLAIHRFLVLKFLPTCLPVWFDGRSGVQWGIGEQLPLPDVR